MADQVMFSQVCLLLLLSLIYQGYYFMSVNIDTCHFFFFSGHVVLHGKDAAWADSKMNLFYFPDDISEANQ